VFKNTGDNIDSYIDSGIEQEASLYFKLSPCSINTPTISSQLCFLFKRPMKKEQCSETSEQKTQTPGNHPKDRIQREDSWHQHIGLEFKEETSEVLHSEHNGLRCYNLDTPKKR